MRSRCAMSQRKRQKATRPKIGPRLKELLAELQITYDEAQFVLQAAEFGAFSAGGHSPDPIADAHLFELLQRIDQQKTANLDLSRNLATSKVPAIRAAVERILQANQDR